MYKLLLLGAPCAGKGTEATLLVSEFNRGDRPLHIPHVSTGDIFRRIQKKPHTPLDYQIKGHMDKNEFVEDSLVYGAIEQRFGESDMQSGYILDGFPRNIEQAEWLEDNFGALSLDAVIHLTADKENLYSRMQKRFSEQGRKDDNTNDFSKRLADYEKNTQPLVGFYERKGILHTIHENGVGFQAQLRTHKRVLDIVYKIR